MLGVADWPGLLDLLSVFLRPLKRVPRALQLLGQPGLAGAVLAAGDSSGVVVALCLGQRALDPGDLGLGVAADRLAGRVSADAVRSSIRFRVASRSMWPFSSARETVRRSAPGGSTVASRTRGRRSGPSRRTARARPLAEPCAGSSPRRTST